jgi:pseudouridylate synthase
MPAPQLDIRSPVATALAAGRPVVAMVSGPIAHTLPWPANLETVRQVEAAVREEGGTLALVGVWKGKPTVGLEPAEMEWLARGGSTLRASRRDLATAVANGLTAGTTVSASMYLAQRAGIRLLATAAIGGVARHDHATHAHPWEMSADLVELSRTPVAVVSAGARNVHNVGYTAEVLESFRVPVVGYGTDVFPTFYLRAGSYPVPVRANTPREVAKLLAAHWGMEGAGIVIANPTPVDTALSPDELIPALEEVQKQALTGGVSRSDLSPFLMDRLNRLTRGKALRAYQATFVANARLAVQVAREFEA